MISAFNQPYYVSPVLSAVTVSNLYYVNRINANIMNFHDLKYYALDILDAVQRYFVANDYFIFATL